MGSILMMTKGMILVTGCSGLVGTHLCQKLEDDGYSVVGVDIKFSPYSHVNNFNITILI